MATWWKAMPHILAPVPALARCPRAVASDLRRPSIPESVDPDPIAQFRRWYDEAFAGRSTPTRGDDARHRLARRARCRPGRCCCAASTSGASSSSRTSRAPRASELGGESALPRSCSTGGSRSVRSAWSARCSACRRRRSDALLGRAGRAGHRVSAWASPQSRGGRPHRARGAAWPRSRRASPAPTRRSRRSGAATAVQVRRARMLAGPRRPAARPRAVPARRCRRVDPRAAGAVNAARRRDVAFARSPACSRSATGSPRRARDRAGSRARVRLQARDAGCLDRSRRGCSIRPPTRVHGAPGSSSRSCSRWRATCC